MAATGKKRKIDIDMDSTEVLKLDEEGTEIVFPPGYHLTKSQYNSLGRINQLQYTLAETIAKQQKVQADQGGPPLVEVLARGGATATAQLDVVYPEGYREEFHTCWRREDEVNRCVNYEGYSMVRASELGEGSTFFSSPDDLVRVGAKGNTEMYLLKEPKTQHDLKIRNLEAMSQRRAASVERSAVESSERTEDGEPLFFTKGDRRERVRFTPISK